MSYDVCNFTTCAWLNQHIETQFAVLFYAEKPQDRVNRCYGGGGNTYATQNTKNTLLKKAYFSLLQQMLSSSGSCVLEEAHKLASSLNLSAHPHVFCPAVLILSTSSASQLVSEGMMFTGGIYVVCLMSAPFPAKMGRWDGSINIRVSSAASTNSGAGKQRQRATVKQKSLLRIWRTSQQLHGYSRKFYRQ